MFFWFSTDSVCALGKSGDRWCVSMCVIERERDQARVRQRAEICCRDTVTLPVMQHVRARWLTFHTSCGSRLTRQTYKHGMTRTLHKNEPPTSSVWLSKFLERTCFRPEFEPPNCDSWNKVLTLIAVVAWWQTAIRFEANMIRFVVKYDNMRYLQLQRISISISIIFFSPLVNVASAHSCSRTCNRLEFLIFYSDIGIKGDFGKQ